MPRWTLFAQIDADEWADMMWGDVGMLNWLARHQDLADEKVESSRS